MHHATSFMLTSGTGASRNRPRRPRGRSLAGILLLVAAGAALAEPRTTNDGVYTPEQAAKGVDVHAKYCAKCHQQSYYEGSFLDAWYGAPMSMLYEVIRMKMPEDRPGALKPREYAALLAWVLERNGYPPGAEPLGEAAAELETVTIARRP